MTVFRCSLLKWSKDLTGTGAFLHGGRWNFPGTYMLYTAENNVLAAFEIALRIPLEQISQDYVMIPLSVPEDSRAPDPSLPKNWYRDVTITRAVGDSFLKEGKSLCMKVPSALISDSFNILINPKHDLIRKVKVMEPRAILFDKRLTDVIRLKSK